MKRVAAAIFWVLLGLTGAWAYKVIAWPRGEPVNSAHILIAALCTYAIGYRYYSKWIAASVLALEDRRATPCEVHEDGKDFVRTNKWIVFGHHFAAISGPGPLVGPVLAAQFGYLPGTLWILIGVALGGAVQDFVILFASLRRDGKSLGEMVKEELNTTAGYIALVAILAILVILLAVLALVVVRALADSPWGVFTVSATIPIAMLMGGYLRYVRVGKVLEASAFGVICLLAAVWGGKLVYQSPEISRIFSLSQLQLACGIVGYGLAASILPVWLLLAPRDYLSTFMKLGTIFALAIGLLVVLPDLKMPALSRFVDGSGPVVAGKIFPFCFITIACGAISGFHTLIASGTTPKLVTRESYARPIGYGAMCLESLVAIMALIAACTLDPGVYLGMNMSGEAATTVAKINDYGFPVTVEQVNHIASEIGEKTLFGRTGGAATLAVGMAQIFSKATHGRWLDLWYHFAIMFEALFILTTIDAGTRVGRYLLQDFLGSIWKPLRHTQHLGPNLLASALMVGAWGYFLIQGVLDPLGGINSLWALFGISNQMLAAIALCLATTIILKMALAPEPPGPPQATADSSSRTSSPGKRRARHPIFALVTLVPLVWLLAATMTAGVQKIWHADPRIGFLAQAKVLVTQRPALEAAVAQAQSGGAPEAMENALKALRANRTQHFNNLLDAAVAGLFLVLVAAIVVLSIREWLLLLMRRKLAVLRENEPVWLPGYAVSEGQPLKAAGLLALAFALARELSVEAQVARAQQQASVHCACQQHPQDAAMASREEQQRLYMETTERRFKGVRRCC
jgi:carbon starvation protein